MAQQRGQTAKQQSKAAAAQAKAALENGTGALETAAEETGEVIGNIDVKKVSGGLGDTGVGFIALAVSVYSAALAYSKFRQAFSKSYTGTP